MLELSISKIILHWFLVDNNEVESGIGYDIIIVCGFMVKLGLLAGFKREFLQWYGAKAPIKEPSGFIGRVYLTSREMSEVVMQTA